MNVAEQFVNVCRTHIVRDASGRRQPLSVHGLVYGLHDGLLRKLGLSASNHRAASEAHRGAIARMTGVLPRPPARGENSLATACRSGLPSVPTCDAMARLHGMTFA
ncbi:MAG: hypothetical protein ABI702_11700, partial [Burkholderiales bacterium]